MDKYLIYISSLECYGFVYDFDNENYRTTWIPHKAIGYRVRSDAEKAIEILKRQRPVFEFHIMLVHI